MKDWKPTKPGIRRTLYEVIFEADTPSGKFFDVVLLLCIIASIFAVMLESVADIDAKYGNALRITEWVLTLIFSLEYVARLYCCQKPAKYAKSFFGVIDLISILPSFISYFYTGGQYLIVLRSIRLLRVFRVLKMTRYIGESEVLLSALRASRHKITVFIFAVVSISLCAGALMHIIEGPESGFTSIPMSMYWAIVTLTTVGYGDIAPQTIPGQSLAALLMISGYGIIAVPTGIVTAELTKANVNHRLLCPSCSTPEQDINAKFCRRCGESLDCEPISEPEAE